VELVAVVFRPLLAALVVCWADVGRCERLHEPASLIKTYAQLAARTNSFRLSHVDAEPLVVALQHPLKSLAMLVALTKSYQPNHVAVAVADVAACKVAAVPWADRWVAELVLASATHLEWGSA
jgi:hypothetical protein